MKAILAGLTLFLSLAPAARAAEWTFLIYLNGNNNLNRFGQDNLRDIETLGSTADVNIVVQWADIESKKTVRMLMKKSTDPTQITSPVLEDVSGVDMGAEQTLVDFIRWGVAHYPANRTFIDVWDHGTGWHGDPPDAGIRATGAAGRFRVTDISHDELTGHWITTPQLADAIHQAALALGHPVDLYGSDACEMGMVEIATEMAADVRYYVGSEVDIPVDGWPYSRFLAKWLARPSMSTPELAGILVNDYAAYYKELNDKDKDGTLSAFDLSQTPGVLAAIGALSRQIEGFTGANLAHAVDGRIEAFGITNDYGDLFDFVGQAQTQGAAFPDTVALDGLREASRRYVIANATTEDFAKNMFGFSIWLPDLVKVYDQYVGDYRALKFSAATHWENAALKLASPK